MKIFDLTGLTLSKTIIDNAGTKLLLYTHSSGALILCAKLDQPKGEVFFETNDNNLILFYADEITLQTLFDANTQTIVSVTEDFECKLYMRSDVNILLRGGDKLFYQLKNKSFSTL